MYLKEDSDTLHGSIVDWKIENFPKQNYKPSIPRKFSNIDIRFCNIAKKHENEPYYT